MEAADVLFVASVLLVFVIFAFGVVSLQLCFVACYRRRAVGSGGSTQQTQVSDPEAPRPPPCRAAAARPKEEEGDAAAAECAVCLAGLEDGGEVARFMPCCGHGFHAQCVGTWLAVASHPTCPLCRVTVARPPEMAPAPASALPPVPHEPASYAANLPAARVFYSTRAC
ncbi:unnamed protein product [Urochloa humidicola]